MDLCAIDLRAAPPPAIDFLAPPPAMDFLAPPAIDFLLLPPWEEPPGETFDLRDTTFDFRSFGGSDFVTAFELYFVTEFFFSSSSVILEIYAFEKKRRNCYKIREVKASVGPTIIT